MLNISLKIFGLTIFLGLFLGFGGLFILDLLFVQLNDQVGTETFFVSKDIEDYFSTNPSFSELSVFFVNLAKERGATYAFYILINANLPFGMDTHLLGHFVGGELYAQKGLEGLEVCTSDLGFACAHSIVIAALFENGLKIFDEINFICEQTEGPGSYAMCFHGFGHAVLAYAEYELPDAIELCKKVGTVKYNNYEIKECIGGVIMEMRGGIHDTDLWEANGLKYLDDDNPFTLCQASYIPLEAREVCYIYLTPFIFDSVGAKDFPTKEDYINALARCEEIELEEYREICYGGFAKEFVNLEYGRDVTKIESSTNEQLEHMAQACYLAPNEEGRSACIEHTIYALTRSGLYEYSLAGRYCSLVSEQYQDVCFRKVVNVVFQYRDTPVFRNEFCDYVETAYKPLCE